jgi:type IV pilus assembly protein PilV
MRKKGSNGFTLVEVLISVFVLALGVIGAAGMQLTALRTTQQSAFQTSALQLAAEMADKMRANDHQMKLADNSNPYLKVDYQSAAGSASADAGPSCYGAGSSCIAGQLAQFDIDEWLKRIDTTLPAGRVLICRDATPWDSGINAFGWDCDASASNAPLVIKIGWQEKRPDGTLVRNADKSFPPGVALTVAPYSK